ncbi:hypothetical protein [Aeromonas veronii]|uniref:hypothetical protein n=1 Tax=Aeromonas veronii TaxID=654 RepID=UPI00330D3A75|nr:DEAD/DEAH box helicase [Aeromonas veronii]
MTTSAHNNNGAVVFPIKAILQQEMLTAQRADRTPRFIQIEKLASADLSGIKELHIDECQILYAGGFRKPVEGLIEVIQRLSTSIPVYLYSATCIQGLLPIQPSTITNVVGTFKRNINVVQIPSTSTITNCTNYIVSVINGAIRYESKPVLAFVNSNKRASQVHRHLGQQGITSIVMTSDTINKVAAARTAYESMLEHSSVAAGGYQVVIATNCLAEGINFYDDFHVISTQCEAGLVFQQQGRAREQATHWLITGEGVDSIHLEDKQVVVHTDAGRSLLWASESVLEDTCKWTEESNKDKAVQYSTLAKNSQRGMCGVQIIQQLAHFGYEPEALTLDEVMVLKKLKNISRKCLMKSVEVHGLPRSMRDQDHSLFAALNVDWKPEQYAEQLEGMIDWALCWDVMQSAGIRGDCWQVYSKVNAIGRKWLVVMLRDIALRDTVSTVVTEYKKQLTNTRISGEVLDEVAGAFWEQLMPASREWEWHTEGQLTMRRNLFRFLMGFVVDDHHNWTLPDPYIGWDVPLSSAEHNRFKVRDKVITGAGYTTEAFCHATGHTKKTIADTKTKTIKQLANDLSMMGI